MRILILSQVYWPDTASTAQHLSDLTLELTNAGHTVTLISSSRAYEKPSERYPSRQQHGAVNVHRLAQTGFSKSSRLGRVINFSTFNLMLLWRLIWMPSGNVDAVLGMTSPPMVSFLGAMVAKWKGWKFCYWAMDLQPELAIQAGMIRKGSLPAKILDAMGRFVFRKSDRIVALDRFMAAYIEQRGAKSGSVCVRRLWPVMEEKYQGARMENPFRISNGFGERIVVMYSGNHAVVHPLDTLLEAALRLRNDARFLFVFIGGGTRVADVTAWKARHQLENIVQLGYRPRAEIHISLSSADLHVVVMGDGQVGFTHPNKVYGAMSVGCAFVAIGPSPSHITDLMDECPGNLSADHGEVEKLTSDLQSFAAKGEAHWTAVGKANAAWAERHLNPSQLIRAMAAEVESVMDQLPALAEVEA